MSSTRCIIQKNPRWGGGIQENQKKKKRRKKKITVPQNCSDFTASVPLQKYLHKCKEHHPLHRIYHNYLQLTGKSRKL